MKASTAMAVTNKPRITWRKEANEQGLARIGQGPRGYELRINGNRVADISPVRNGFKLEYIGWMWSCASNDELGIAWKNTSAEKRKPYPMTDDGMEQAKADCKTYIVTCLKAKGLV